MMAVAAEADLMRILDRRVGEMPSDREALKDFVASMVKHITLAPANLTCRIYCAIPLQPGNSSRPHGDSNPGPAVKGLRAVN
jgi:hypothetical protein